MFEKYGLELYDNAFINWKPEEWNTLSVGSLVSLVSFQMIELRASNILEDVFYHFL